MNTRLRTNLVLLVFVEAIFTSLWFIAGEDILGNSFTSVVMVFLFGSISLMPLVKKLWRRERNFDVFEVDNIVLLIYFFYFTLRVFYLVAFGDYRVAGLAYLDGSDLYMLINLGLFYALVGLLCFYMGYTFSLGSSLAFRLPYPAATWHTKRARTVVFVYSLIGAICYALLVSRIGTLDFILLNLNRINLFLEGKGYIYSGSQLLIIATIFWFASLSKARESKLFWVCCICVFLMFMVLGRRSTILLLIGSMLIIYHYLFKKIRLKSAIVFGSLLFSLLISIYVYRIVSGHSQKTKLYDSLSENPLVFVMEQSEFRNFDMFLLIIEETPERIPHHWGSDILNIFYTPMPRSIWPDKPKPVGLRLVNEFFPERKAGIPPTLLGQLYLNFHLPGIMVGMLLLGIFCKTIYVYFQLHKNNVAVVILYSISLYFVWDILRVGDLARPISVYIFNLAVLFVGIFYVVRGRLRKRSYHANAVVP